MWNWTEPFTMSSANGIRRTDALAYQQIRVIRFRNEEVLSDLASVVDRIRIAALEQEESE